MFDIHEEVKKIEEDIEKTWKCRATDDQIAAAILLDHDIFFSREEIARVRKENKASK